MSDLKEEVKPEELQGENLANADATTGENKADEQAKEAPKKPTKEAKTSEATKLEDLTKSIWKVINPFMHGEDSKRVKYEVGEKLPKDFSQEELERFVSLGIIGKA